MGIQCFSGTLNLGHMFPLGLISYSQRGRVWWLLGHCPQGQEGQFGEKSVQTDAPQCGTVPRLSALSSRGQLRVRAFLGIVNSGPQSQVQGTSARKMAQSQVGVGESVASRRVTGAGRVQVLVRGTRQICSGAWAQGHRGKGRPQDSVGLSCLPPSAALAHPGAAPSSGRSSFVFAAQIHRP